MELNKPSPFRTTRNVQSHIQEFLDVVSISILAYQEGMIAYLKEGWQEKAEEKLDQISGYESRGDSLRSRIGMTLYTEMLFIVQNVFEQQVFAISSPGHVSKTGSEQFFSR